MAMSKKFRLEWDYFINPETGRRAYNTLCRKCCKPCKQSFRAIVVNCPNYLSKRSKYREEVNDNGDVRSGQGGEKCMDA